MNHPSPFSLLVFVKTVEEKRVRILLLKDNCKNHLSCSNSQMLKQGMTSRQLNAECKEQAHCYTRNNPLARAILCMKGACNVRTRPETRPPRSSDTLLCSKYMYTYVIRAILVPVFVHVAAAMKIQIFLCRSS
jgi:hypothetical protein